MDDKWQAQNTFWNSFGIPAYDENTVPENAEMPYITYGAVSAGIGTAQMLTASIWYRSSSWADISRKADEMEEKISSRKKPSEKIKGGRFKARIPDTMAFAQRMGEQDDPDVRRIVINVEAEFLTAF